MTSLFNCDVYMSAAWMREFRVNEGRLPRDLYGSGRGVFPVEAGGLDQRHDVGVRRGLVCLEVARVRLPAKEGDENREPTASGDV